MLENQGYRRLIQQLPEFQKFSDYFKFPEFIFSEIEYPYIHGVVFVGLIELLFVKRSLNNTYDDYCKKFIEIILNSSPQNIPAIFEKLYKKMIGRLNINDLSFKQNFEILVNSDDKELDKINRFKTMILSRKDILKNVSEVLETPDFKKFDDTPKSIMMILSNITDILPCKVILYNTTLFGTEKYEKKATGESIGDIYIYKNKKELCLLHLSYTALIQDTVNNKINDIFVEYFSILQNYSENIYNFLSESQEQGKISKIFKIPNFSNILKNLNSLLSEIPKESILYSKVDELTQLFKDEIDLFKKNESINEIIKNIQELKLINNQFKCISCKDFLQSPITLKCNHRICIKCIKASLTKILEDQPKNSEEEKIGKGWVLKCPKIYCSEYIEYKLLNEECKELIEKIGKKIEISHLKCLLCGNSQEDELIEFHSKHALCIDCSIKEFDKWNQQLFKAYQTETKIELKQMKQIDCPLLSSNICFHKIELAHIFFLCFDSQERNTILRNYLKKTKNFFVFSKMEKNRQDNLKICHFCFDEGQNIIELCGKNCSQSCENCIDLYFTACLLRRRFKCLGCDINGLHYFFQPNLPIKCIFCSTPNDLCKFSECCKGQKCNLIFCKPDLNKYLHLLLDKNRACIMCQQIVNDSKLEFLK